VAITDGRHGRLWRRPIIGHKDRPGGGPTRVAHAYAWVHSSRGRRQGAYARTRERYGRHAGRNSRE